MYITYVERKKNTKKETINYYISTTTVCWWFRVLFWWQNAFKVRPKTNFEQMGLFQYEIWTNRPHLYKMKKISVGREFFFRSILEKEKENNMTANIAYVGRICHFTEFFFLTLLELFHNKISRMSHLVRLVNFEFRENYWNVWIASPKPIFHIVAKSILDMSAHNIHTCMSELHGTIINFYHIINSI